MRLGVSIYNSTSCTTFVGLESYEAEYSWLRTLRDDADADADSDSSIEKISWHNGGGLVEWHHGVDESRSFRDMTSEIHGDHPAEG